MDEETLRDLLRSRQERQGETLQLLQQQHQLQQQTRRDSILQQLNLVTSASDATSGLLARARSPVEAPAPAGLDQLLAIRRSSLISASTQGNIYAQALQHSPTHSLAATRNDLSSLAINQEIKRLEELQQQLASTRTSSNNPLFSNSLRSRCTSASSAKLG